MRAGYRKNKSWLEAWDGKKRRSLGWSALPPVS